MKIKKEKTVYEDIGFTCDVCMRQVMNEDHDMSASLSADFGYGSEEDGNRYHIDLCESCFKSALADLKRQRKSNFMFDEDKHPDEDFGRYS